MLKMVTPQWGHKDIEVRQVDSVSQGFYHLRRFHLRYRCFSGQWSEWVIREQFKHANAVAVILYDPDTKKVVLVEQLRIGLIEASPVTESPWLVEVVAGLVDEGEDKEDAARRETREETGLEISRLFKICEFYNSPGGFTEKTSLYCGVIAAPSVGGVYGVATEQEDIRIHILPVKTIFTAWQRGEILTSASTVIALQWLLQVSKEPSSSIYSKLS